MKRHYVLLFILFLITLIGWYAWPTPKRVGDLTLSPDLYPLYDSLVWSPPTAESVLIGTTTYLGTSITASAATTTMNPGAAFTPFETYYGQKLRVLGWNVANDLAAGGHVGGQTGYKKGSDIILVRFSINYHIVSSSSPSECPCDVALSLFSTQK